MSSLHDDDVDPACHADLPAKPKPWRRVVKIRCVTSNPPRRWKIVYTIRGDDIIGRAWPAATSKAGMETPL
jgi:hypothetical protein